MKERLRIISGCPGTPNTSPDALAARRRCRLDMEPASTSPMLALLLRPRGGAAPPLLVLLGSMPWSRSHMRRRDFGDGCERGVPLPATLVSIERWEWDMVTRGLMRPAPPTWLAEATLHRVREWTDLGESNWFTLLPEREGSTTQQHELAELTRWRR